MRVGKEELRKQIEKYVKVSFGKAISETLFGPDPSPESTD